MTRSALSLLLAFVITLGGCGGETQEPEATASAAQSEPVAEPAGVPFLALHLYNPASEEVHGQFLGLLAELNAAVLSTGLSDTQYAVWKVAGEQSGAYGHLFGSIWPDRATYDAVHAHEAYGEVMGRIQAAGLEPFESEVYDRYLLLNPGPADAPARATPPSYLSLHRLNLDPAGEARLLEILEAGNAVVAAAGHPETRYGLWKITGEQAGDHAYVFGSLWADLATYEAVHALPEYEAFVAENGADYEAIVAGEVYNQYEAVSLD